MNSFVTACVVATLTLQIAPTCNGAERTGKPNVIIIYSDDHGDRPMPQKQAPSLKVIKPIFIRPM